MKEPTQAVAIIIITRDNHILLQQRADLRNWTLPGGKLEDGETWQEAAIREALEETGYHIAIDKPVGEYYWYSRHLPISRSKPLLHSFACTAHITGGIPIGRTAETLQIKPFETNNLPLVLNRFSRQYINDALLALSPTSRTVVRAIHIPWPEAALIQAVLTLTDLYDT